MPKRIKNKFRRKYFRRKNRRAARSRAGKNENGGNGQASGAIPLTQITIPDEESENRNEANRVNASGKNRNIPLQFGSHRHGRPRPFFHARRRQSFASLPDQRSIQATPGITPTGRLSRGLREIRISMRLCVAIEQFPTIIRTGPATRRNAASSHSRTGARCIHRPPYWATLIS